MGSRRATRLTFRLALIALILFAAICAEIVHRQEHTVWNLLHPSTGPVTTDVYAAWTDLSPARPITWEKTLALLRELHYQEVAGPLTQPGQYQVSDPQVIIFSRGFAYPDETLPDQRLHLGFSEHRLEALEDDEGKNIPETRLEPKRLAQWVSPDSATHPQTQLAALPAYVPAAVVAVEDKRFYRHGAFDGIGIARAVWVDFRHGRLRQGASTISQQLARSIFLNVNRTVRRKIVEAALAFYLEVRYSKPQLLEMYLNQVYWGKDGAQSLLGIESTSQSYFGKPAASLTLAESALLAGLLESPNRLSPRRDPVAALQRRNVVLRLMREQTLITPEQEIAASSETLKLAPLSGHVGSAAYFLATLQDQLAERYSLPQLLTQKWRIFTTLDAVLQTSAEDSIATLAHPGAPQAALMAMDPESGAVRAWVGGTNYQTSPFDRALYALRQPGSAFKPFVALTALESRKTTTATLLDDTPLSVRAAGERWSPQNYDRAYHGKVSVWDSLIQSRNVPMVRLAMQVGLPAIVVSAHQAGIMSALRPVPSLALGTSEVSLFELTNAYGTLADGGLHVEPYTIETILAANGQMVEAHPAPAPERVFSPEAVALVTQMLQKVLDEGTAKAARSMGFAWPAAGKTGTSENYQDAWFIGYSSGIVCGVWVGYDQPKTLGHSAAGIALPVWVRFMNQALALDPPGSFEVPKDLVWKTIDPVSGLLVRSGCVQRRSVAFLRGTEPTKFCPLHSGGLIGFFKRMTS